MSEVRTALCRSTPGVEGFFEPSVLACTGFIVEFSRDQRTCPKILIIFLKSKKYPYAVLKLLFSLVTNQHPENKLRTVLNTRVLKACLGSNSNLPLFVT